MSRQNKICERLHADLQAKGVRVWYFPEDAKWGESVWVEIDRCTKVQERRRLLGGLTPKRSRKS